MKQQWIGAMQLKWRKSLTWGARRNDLIEDPSTLSKNILEDICSKTPGITFSDNKGGVQTNCPYKGNFTVSEVLHYLRPKSGEGQKIVVH